MLQLKARYQLYKQEKEERREARRSTAHSDSAEKETTFNEPNESKIIDRSITVDPADIAVNLEERSNSVQIYRSQSEAQQNNAAERRRNYAARIGKTFRKTRLFRSRSSVGSRREKVHFPRLPYDNTVKPENLGKRAKTIEDYLNRVFNCDQKRKFRQLKEFRQMFGISNFTYVKELGFGGFEGDMDKLSGATSFDKSCMRIARCHWGGIIQCWRKRWILLRSSFIAIIRDGKEIRQVILFDRSTKFEEDKAGLKYHIKNVSSHLELKCGSMYELSSWRHRFHDISQIMDNKFKRNGGIEQSFAPLYKLDVNRENHARWYLCGQAYYRRLLEYIDKARQEIFIAGWWILPDIELANPDGSRSKQLIDILIEKAKCNVKVFILVFNNVESVLPLGNYERCVKAFREKARDNDCKNQIHVLYHPDARALLLESSKKSGTGFEWAHHEKVVIVDQSTAFVGGIDIAPSRFDIHGKFPLFDPKRKTWKGKDFGNHHTADLAWPEFEHDYPSIDRMKDPAAFRCPWQDVAVQVWGPSARDVGRHFIERWNQSKRQLKKDKSDTGRGVFLFLPYFSMPAPFWT